MVPCDTARGRLDLEPCWPARARPVQHCTVLHRALFPRFETLEHSCSGPFGLEERRYPKMAAHTGNTHTGWRDLELIERTPKVRAPGLRRGCVRERRVFSGHPLLI